MRVSEARALIGEKVTRTARDGFARWHEDMGYAERPAPPPLFRAGTDPAGHDASCVPEVPPAEVESSVTDGTPGMFFSHKSEYGERPLVQPGPGRLLSAGLLPSAGCAASAAEHRLPARALEAWGPNGIRYGVGVGVRGGYPWVRTAAGR